ncbi:hypothetical protein CHLRE_10g427150v5 [Chlamydomonas reinhardtii]|uniref:Pre-mRNA-splicing factor ISY1 n=1 Tax=Chlamydomonas reinhardtii TaxID=3055 RepID=A8IC04_CHLRE|nr:uncharacterized protein CHLRE_10g427150v5 [Chlamydomonas reinhardtii]PNW77216.1 hypothetical protein CHLRE_10g427150v5 [Chlamydomonas reinhardtii]|eukprot:XP_001702552.1 predicted protein [Chlamydomonas reinhardtii]
MARNEEKAQSMLNRFLAGKVEEKKGPKAKRPYLASECRDLVEADKWRSQIIREVGKKVMEIQNEGLGEHRIRDLNDEINKLIREKGHWERRIKELGGPDYSRTTSKVTDSKGMEVAEMTGKGRGYTYFGAAKKLPGVKELFEAEPVKQVRRSRYAMHRSIDPDYYGFRDEEDGVLERVEEEAEKLMRMQAVLDWEEKEAERQAAVKSGAVGGKGGAGGGTGGAEGEERFIAYVPLPDQQAIEAKILEMKRTDLLSKYTSEALMHQQAEAKSLLNKK